MKATEMQDPLHREALETYVKWLNGWFESQGDDTRIGFDEFEVNIYHDTGPEWVERSVTMRVDYGDDGGPQWLWVYALMLTDQEGTTSANLESLVQGFDTYVSVVVNSGKFNEGWKEGA